MSDEKVGWKFNYAAIDNGLGTVIKGEIEPEHFDLLRAKSFELSRKIIEQEEYIVVSGMTDAALFKLRDQCQRELINRGKR